MQVLYLIQKLLNNRQSRLITKKYLTLLTVAILFFSCSSENHEYTKLKEIESFALYKIDTLSEDVTSIIGDFYLANYNNNLLCYFSDKKNKKIHIYNLLKNKKEIEVDLTCLSDIIKINKRTDIHLISPDSIVLFSNEDQKALLIDFAGNILDEFITTDDFFPFSGVSVSYYDRCFIYNNGKLNFIYAYSDLVLTNTDRFKQYYKRPISLTIDLRDTQTNLKHSLYAPKNYSLGNYFGDFEYDKCIGKNNLYFYSFPANDTLFIYNDSLQVFKVFCGSKYKPQFVPYDLTKLQNFSNLREYNRTSPFYRKIVYDPYQHRYYRVFKRETSFTNEDGSIKRNNELPWSIILMSEDFNILGEIDMDPTKYSMYTILPTPNGLLISQAMEKSVSENTIRYCLMELE